MKLKDRIKTYNFWVSLASAVFLIISTLGKKFNFSVDENMYNDLFTSFCGILVLLGIIIPPSNSQISDLFDETFSNNNKDDDEKESDKNEQNHEDK